MDKYNAKISRVFDLYSTRYYLDKLIMQCQKVLQCIIGPNGQTAHKENCNIDRRPKLRMQLLADHAER